MSMKPEVLRSSMVIGNSPLMEELMDLAVKMAPSLMPVLVTGPTGSGKEVIASVLHLMRGDPHLPFVDLNCAAIPENLMESLLFGHEKGVFTGAVNRHRGYFSMAGEGSLFLDEIGEMPPAQQAKQLRVIEFREFWPLGGARRFSFRGRIVAANQEGHRYNCSSKRGESDDRSMCCECYKKRENEKSSFDHLLNIS